MNMVHNLLLILAKSTQKLKYCPILAAKKSKVEILSKSAVVHTKESAHQRKVIFGKGATDTVC
jgi:hypothetical protein